MHRFHQVTALLLFMPVSILAEMHCLVARPGFGLVSERCPAHAVACRIRIEHEAVSFYEYSPLYDRNQFVCVLKGEFGEQHGSGCVRKRSGHVRCWCFGRANCNTPENSKLLYSSFISGDESKFHEAVQQVDFTDLVDDEAENSFTPATVKNAAFSTTAFGITKMARQWMMTTFSPSTSPLTTTTPNSAEISELSTTESPKVEEKESHKMTQKAENPHHHKHKPVSAHAKPKHQKQHEKQKMPQSHADSKSSSSPTTQPSKIKSSTSSLLVTPSSAPLRSEYDRRNRVHVIHVSARDHYEPVNLFGSPALQRIMERERQLLKAEVEDASTEEFEDEDDIELEELNDDWDSGEQQSVANQQQSLAPKRVAERSQKQMEEPKPTLRVKLLKTRLEQRQRTPGLSSTSASAELEEAVGDEYFDSAFYAPSSANAKIHGWTEMFACLLLPIFLFQIAH